MVKDVEALIDSAARAHAAGNLDVAERLARKALDAQPGDARAALLIGIVLVKKDNAAAAVPILRRAIELDENSFEASFWLSMAFRRVGAHQEAREHAQLAVHRNPESEHALNQLGMCHLDLDEREEALDLLWPCLRDRAEHRPLFR